MPLVKDSRNSLHYSHLNWRTPCSFLGMHNFSIHLYVPFTKTQSQCILRAMESRIGEMNEGTEKNLRDAFKHTNLKQELCMVLRKRPRRWG